MKKSLKFMSVIMSFLLIAILGQATNVQAASTYNYKIISDSEVTAKQAEKWAKSKGATETFIDLADLYWEYSSEHGDVNPAIAYVQAAKETGYGKFGGVIDESYHNPCGLKTAQGGDDYDPEAHTKFDSWDEGVQAHLDHLALYAGAEGYPRDDTYDTRHFKTVLGKSTTTDDLNGTWSSSSTYGTELSALYTDLLVYSGVKTENEKDVDEETETDKVTLPNVESVNTSGNNNINIWSSIGWRNYNGSWYYYKSDKSLATGWINPDNNWYYMNSDGKMATGWVKLGETWYYLNSSGVMDTGWKSINGKWYYFQGNGSMVTGLKKINDKIYYLSSNGDMLTGSQVINNNTYYFNSDGSMDESKIVSNDNDKNNNVVSNTKKTIVIDPGHARGMDSGVVVGDYDETELNMEVALKLEAKLQSLGYNVILTRDEDDSFASLNESLSHRVDVANDNNADFFISIHHNSVDGIPTASGVETYYSVNSKDSDYGGGLDSARLEKSKEIAKLINDNIAEKLSAKNRGAKADSSADVGNLFILRNTNMPAVLVEAGFLTNTEEAERCADSTSQQLLVDAIAEVIKNNI